MSNFANRVERNERFRAPPWTVRGVGGRVGGENTCLWLHQRVVQQRCWDAYSRVGQRVKRCPGEYHLWWCVCLHRRCKCYSLQMTLSADNRLDNGSKFALHHLWFCVAIRKKLRKLGRLTFCRWFPCTQGLPISFHSKIGHYTGKLCLGTVADLGSVVSVFLPKPERARSGLGEADRPKYFIGQWNFLASWKTLHAEFFIFNAFAHFIAFVMYCETV